jgi:hypothetical protein
MSKDKYKVRNWSIYNKGLEERGNINILIPEDLVNQWQYKYDKKELKKRGGEYVYSEAAINFCLTVRYMYKLPYRANRGFIGSLFSSLQLSLPIPSISQLCKRSKQLSIDSMVSRKKITDIAIDSTGLKVYGEGEWKVRKHGAGKHRTWMKLHVAIDIETQEIEGMELTSNSVDDATCAGTIITSIESGGGSIRSLRGDGGYDREKVRKVAYEKNIQQIIPPQSNAVLDKDAKEWMQERNQAIVRLKGMSRKDWKVEVGYHKRSLAETVMFRYKTIHGAELKSRNLENQKTEVKIKCNLLNVFINLAKPDSYKVA